MALIKSIQELRKYAKISASKDWDTYSMFVEDAQERYFEPYFGFELLQSLDDKPLDPLTIHLCRSLGPFSLALATDEMSIQFGETGHTVARTENLAPASDAKIEKARKSLYERGWSNLEKSINYVREHQIAYPEWSESVFAKQSKTLLFDTPESFQENGLVNIDYSSLTFFMLRQLILRIEKTETLMFLPDEIRESVLNNRIDDLPKTLVDALLAYTASRVASIYTSNSSLEQQKKSDFTEYKPVILPLYDDSDNAGNFFERQADYWKSQIANLLVSSGLVTDDYRQLKFNNSTRKIFVAGATRDEI